MDDVYLGNPLLKKQMLLKNLLKNKFLSLWHVSRILYILQNNM